MLCMKEWVAKEEGGGNSLERITKEYLGENCDHSLGSEHASLVCFVKQTTTTKLANRNWNLVRGKVDSSF